MGFSPKRNHLMLNKKVIFFLIVLIAVYFAHTFCFIRFTIDDAYITFKYANNVIHSNGPVFNPGEKVNANSSFLWMVLLLPFEIIREGSIYGSKILSIVFTILAVIYSIKIINHFIDSGKEKYIILFFLLFVFNSSLINWSINGLENPLIYLLLVLLFYNMIHEIPAQKGYKTLFILFALSAARAEGFIFIFYYFMVIILYKVFAGGKVEKTYLIKYSVAITGFCIIYYGAMYLYYGDPLPNSVYAKMNSNIVDAIPLGIGYLFARRNIVNLSLLIIPVIMFAVLFYAGKKEKLFEWKILSLLILSSTYFLFSIAVGGDWMPNYRFISFALLLNILSFTILYPRLVTLTRKIIPVMGIFVFLYIIMNVYVTYKNYLYQDELYSATVRACKGAALFINETEKTNKNNQKFTVAASDIGMFGYYLNGRVLDYYGLSDSHLAHSGYSVGNVNWDYVLQKKPDYIIVYSNTERIGDNSFNEGMAETSKKLFMKKEFLEKYHLLKSFYFWDKRWHLVYARENVVPKYSSII